MPIKNLDISKYKAAIFDMDGTMIRNMSHHKKAWQEFLSRHGVHLSDEEFHAKISGKKNDAIFEIVFGRQLSQNESEKYTAEKELLYRELYKNDIEEVEGLTDFIAKLHNLGLKTAIATTAPKPNREFALKSLDLRGKFEVILGDEHVSNGKPHPEIYLKAAKKLGIKPEDCVVLEDSPPGIQSAKSAGMTVVGILTSHSKNDLSEADYLVHNFTELV